MDTIDKIHARNSQIATVYLQSHKIIAECSKSQTGQRGKNTSTTNISIVWFLYSQTSEELNCYMETSVIVTKSPVKLCGHTCLDGAGGGFGW